MEDPAALSYDSLYISRYLACYPRKPVLNVTCGRNESSVAVPFIWLSLSDVGVPLAERYFKKKPERNSELLPLLVA